MRNSDLPIDVRAKAFRLFLEAVSRCEDIETPLHANPSFLSTVLEGVREVGDAEVGTAVFGYGKEFAKNNPAGYVALRLAFDLTEDNAQVGTGFVDVELLSKKAFVVYFDDQMLERNDRAAEKVIEKYGKVNVIAVPGDTIFEGVQSNVYIFHVTPNRKVKESLDEKKKAKAAGVLWKRARTSAKLSGVDSSLIRKSMLRAMGTKKVIVHNIYSRDGDPASVEAWKRFVGLKSRKKK